VDCVLFKAIEFKDLTLLLLLVNFLLSLLLLIDIGIDSFDLVDIADLHLDPRSDVVLLVLVRIHAPYLQILLLLTRRVERS